MKEQARALALADLLFLLAELLRAPAAGARSLPAADRAALSALLAAAGLASPQRATALFADCLARAGREPAALAEAQSALFEGAAPCAANETAFVRRDKGALLADIAGFYRAFGFAPAAGTGEKADHLGAELEFVALLLVMRAQAAAAGEAEAAAVTHEALCAYWADHLGEWLPAFCARLAALAPDRHHRRLARLLALAGTRVAAELGLVFGESAPPLPPPGDEEAEAFRCGLLRPTGA